MKGFRSILLTTIILGGVVMATPSLIGTNGIIHMPTAYSLSSKQVDIGINAFSSNTPGNPNWTYCSNLGVFEGVELGFIGNNINEGVFINLKLFMVSDKSSPTPLRIAGGFNNISSHTQTDMYLVLSKMFSKDVNGHFGFTSNVMSNNIKADVMFGLEVGLNDTMAVVGDLIGSGSTWNLSSGVRYKMSEEFGLNGYISDIGNSTPSKTALVIGLAWHGFLQ